MCIKKLTYLNINPITAKKMLHSSKVYDLNKVSLTSKYNASIIRSHHKQRALQLHH